MCGVSRRLHGERGRKGQQGLTSNLHLSATAPETMVAPVAAKVNWKNQDTYIVRGRLLMQKNRLPMKDCTASKHQREPFYGRESD